MTTNERFERIETTLQATTETLQVLAQSQTATQTAVAGISDAHARNQATLQTLMESVTRYIDAAEARTRRLEENLDGLIRAITAEHSNGKSHPQ